MQLGFLSLLWCSMILSRAVVRLFCLDFSSINSMGKKPEETKSKNTKTTHDPYPGQMTGASCEQMLNTEHRKAKPKPNNTNKHPQTTSPPAPSAPCEPRLAEQCWPGQRQTWGWPRPPNTFRRLRTDDAAHDDVLGRRGQAVFQIHAAPQFVQRGGVRDAAYIGAIRFGNMMLGVREFIQKIAVVGQKD